MPEVAERDPLDIEVGARIRLRRRELGMSQAEVGARLGYTFQQLQKYERGANRVAASTLIRLAAALQTSVSALVGETVESPVIGAQMTIHGAPELLIAYAAIPDASVRRHILALAEDVRRLLSDGANERQDGTDERSTI